MCCPGTDGSLVAWAIEMLLECHQRELAVDLDPVDRSLFDALVLLQHDWPRHAAGIPLLLEKIRGRGGLQCSELFTMIRVSAILEEFLALINGGINIAMEEEAPEQPSRGKLSTRGVKKQSKSVTLTQFVDSIQAIVNERAAVASALALFLEERRAEA
eukprot:m.60677 g.60677  ORF g.60677 m.60677 type:complete len:158 (+) comp7295_c0_seq1:1742-2215(+)